MLAVPIHVQSGKDTVLRLLKVMGDSFHSRKMSVLVSLKMLGFASTLVISVRL